jgi:fluoroquinolone resistance protein
MTFSSDEFGNQTFQKLICHDQDITHKTFSNCTFEHCDFSRSNLSHSNFLDCTFSSCNLSLIKVEGVRLQGISFEKSKLLGINFARCEQRFLSITCKGSLIDTCNFSTLDLKGTKFLDCMMRDNQFTETKLTSADFTKSDLRGSTFHHADLCKASFTEAINYSINPLTNKLTKARFSKPEVMNLLLYLDIIIE